MKECTFDGMVAYFNRRVSEMDIAQDYKMELLGMVTALGYKHEKTTQQWIPCSERLPEYDAPALLSTAWGKTEIGWWTQRGWMIVPASYREFKQDAVVAWMPLPEPWEGDHHD